MWTRGQRRSRVGVVLWLAAAWISGAPVDAQRGSEAESAGAALVARVVRGLEEAGEPSRAALRELERLGDPALPGLFALLEAGEVAGDDGRSTPLGTVQRDVLEAALLGVSRDALRAFLERRVDGELSFSAAGVALFALEHGGLAKDLRLAVRVTASASLEPRNSVADALRACAAAILRRDPSTWGHFAAALSDAPTGALEPLLRAAGDAGDARSFDTLRSVLSGSACPVAYTLDALASVAARIEPPFDASLREQVRAHLGAGDPQAARAAAVVAGKLEDVDAVSELIELLESGDPAVGRAAHGALQAIGRMSFRADPRRWRSWHAGEVEWWENESPSALRRLHGDDGPEAIRSIGEMVSHRLHRHELAVELAELLGHEDPAMRRVACAGLGQMGSGLAVPELVLALDDDDETVRAAASGALQVLTGRVLGADPDAWRAVLESGAGRLVK